MGLHGGVDLMKLAAELEISWLEILQVSDSKILSWVVRELARSS